jgi:hypothetical protein
MNVQSLLSSLQGVKRTGQGRWSARCPAHEDKRPSLSIRELEDGRILLHCFGGCEVGAVLSSIGLDLDALYPEREINSGKPERRPFPTADVFRALGDEILLVTLASLQLQQGKALTPDQHSRLVQACGRIRGAAREAGL